MGGDVSVIRVPSLLPATSILLSTRCPGLVSLNLAEDGSFDSRTPCEPAKAQVGGERKPQSYGVSKGPLIAKTEHLNVSASPRVECGVMSDPAVSARAAPTEVIVGNEATFEDFFRGQTQSLYAHLCLITGNRAEAEELAQDAFLKVWERWDRVADMEEPVGYLYRTAMNLFRKRYRRAMLTLRKSVSEELRRDEFAGVDDRSIVARALAELAPRQRAALVLTELIGFRSEEAGHMLGVSAGTVRALASQGRAAMKRALEDDDV